MKKKAILVVSFGTSHMDTKGKTIDRIKQEISNTYPEYEIYEAFTSKIIIEVVKKRDHITIYTVSEALEAMYQEGIRDIIVQPTHILNGIENDAMILDVKAQQMKFDTVRIGCPLLTTTQDYFETMNGLMEVCPTLDQDEALVLMGHGTDHYVNTTYAALNYMFEDNGYDHTYVAAVEAYPYIEDIMKRLKKKAYKKIYLAPFMIVAGEHAKNDMVGEEADSWINCLQKAGYKVEPIVRGIGEYEFASRIFIDHIKKAALL